MTIARLMFGKGVSLKLRLLASLNVIASLYFLLMTGLVTYVCWFIILPKLHRFNDNAVAVYDAIIVYIFTNAIGNYILCVTTKSTVDVKWCLSEDEVGRVKSAALDHPRRENIQPAQKQDHLGSTDKAIRERSRDKVGFVENGKKYKLLQICKTCNVFMPLRAHHCVLCDKCILRRDHHCFFMTTCIGHNNHRYFILYCLYMTLGIFFGLVLIFRYLNENYNVKFFSPLTFFTFLYKFFSELGTLLDLYPEYVFFVFLLYACLLTGLGTTAFTFWHLAITFSGQTSHEAWNGITRFDTGSVYKNCRQLFGRYWFVSLFMPLPFSLDDDGYFRSRYRKKRP